MVILMLIGILISSVGDDSLIQVCKRSYKMVVDEKKKIHGNNMIQKNNVNKVFEYHYKGEVYSFC